HAVGITMNPTCASTVPHSTPDSPTCFASTIDAATFEPAMPTCVMPRNRMTCAPFRSIATAPITTHDTAHTPNATSRPHDGTYSGRCDQEPITVRPHSTHDHDTAHLI